MVGTNRVWSAQSVLIIREHICGLVHLRERLLNRLTTAPKSTLSRSQERPPDQMGRPHGRAVKIWAGSLLQRSCDVREGALAMTSPASISEPADAVWGAAAIGEVVGLSARMAFYRLSRGEIPGRKVGSSWVASRKRLTEWLAGDALAA